MAYSFRLSEQSRVLPADVFLWLYLTAHRGQVVVALEQVSDHLSNAVQQAVNVELLGKLSSFKAFEMPYSFGCAAPSEFWQLPAAEFCLLSAHHALTPSRETRCADLPWGAFLRREPTCFFFRLRDLRSALCADDPNLDFLRASARGSPPVFVEPVRPGGHALC